MSGKWVQAENNENQKLDVYVWMEVPELITGTATVLEKGGEVPSILGPDGKPLRTKQQQHRLGFGKP